MTARLRRWALARPRVLLVDAPGQDASRWQVESETDRRGWPRASSPAGTDLLVVVGEPGPDLLAAIDVLWSQVPRPRHRVDLDGDTDAGAALDAAAAALLEVAPEDEAVADPAELLAARHDDDMGDDDMGGMDHGDMGGGGSGDDDMDHGDMDHGDMDGGGSGGDDMGDGDMGGMDHGDMDGGGSGDDDMDHGDMDHGDMGGGGSGGDGMDHGDMGGGGSGGDDMGGGDMDHGDMDGGGSGDDDMDHGDMGGMDGGDMGGMDHGGMDHGDMDHGDMGGMDHGDMGGMDHGGMEVAGLAMADTAPDRDGLQLDALAVSLGPVLPGWPTGLVLRGQLQGDVLTGVELSWADPDHPSAEPQLPGDGQQRALDQLARFLEVAGWPTVARTARQARDGLRSPDPAVVEEARALAARVARQVRRSRMLAWSVRGTGLAEGPAWAGAHGADALQGDVLDRVRRCAERAAAPGEETGPAPESPLEDVARLLEGSELGAARLTVASLVLPYRSAAQQAEMAGV